MSEASDCALTIDDGARLERIDYRGSLGFFLLHAACLLTPLVGISWAAVAACLASFAVRMFGITAGFHRYFSHRTFRTGRAFQFLLAVLGTMAAQKGPLWWAAQHRHHHRHADAEDDVHSPVTRGLWWAHVGWILCRKYAGTNLELVRDLHRFPELRLLNRLYLLPPFVLAVLCFTTGAILERYAPGLHTSGAQILVYGFFVSTVLLYHNNHHHCPSSERQGLRWWEVDVAHYALVMLSWVGIVWDLHAPPGRSFHRGR
jgi:stearoyl-CoA desaturase (delta-9 desaturase)